MPETATDTATVEAEQQRTYPGLHIRRDGDAIVVHVPIRFRRRNGRQMVLTEDGTPAPPERQASRPLVEALAKAHRWQDQLEAGEYAGLDELADAVGVDRTYAGRILRLTNLAPDLVEAILRGDDPDGISLERLRRDLPVRWEEQRSQWGGIHPWDFAE